jgi:hypothetical protein
MKSIEKIIQDKDFGKIQYIAHTFDEVEIGEGKDSLLEIESKILEVHIFDGQKEVFARRVGGQIMPYNVIEITSTDFLERRYKIENNIRFIKSAKKERISDNDLLLLVREQVDYEDNQAFISKTMIVGFEIGGTDYGKIK